MAEPSFFRYACMACNDYGQSDTGRLFLFEMPMEVRLEFGTVVGLNDVDTERHASQDIIDEFNGRPLRAGVIDL